MKKQRKGGLKLVMGEFVKIEELLISFLLCQVYLSPQQHSSLAMPQSSCLCGLNRISWITEPILIFRCHCMDERKLTGAGFALNVVVSIETLKVESGKLSVWGKVVESGNTIYNHSCSQ